MSGRHQRAESGLTLTEVMIALALAAVLGVLVIRTMGRMDGLQSSHNLEARLHAEGHRALSTIVQDLKRAAFQVATGDDLPYVFDGGVATGAYSMHAHTPAAHEAQPGDEDYGPNREIVFVLPADADDDGRPDLVANAVVWSTDQISYTVTTDTTGNALVRRINGGSPRIVARNVERVVFDNARSSGFSIPLAGVRVQIFFRARDARGVLYQHRAETMVLLQSKNP